MENRMGEYRRNARLTITSAPGSINPRFRHAVCFLANHDSFAANSYIYELHAYYYGAPTGNGGILKIKLHSYYVITPDEWAVLYRVIFREIFKPPDVQQFPTIDVPFTIEFMQDIFDTRETRRVIRYDNDMHVIYDTVISRNSAQPVPAPNRARLHPPQLVVPPPQRPRISHDSLPAASAAVLPGPAPAA